MRQDARQAPGDFHSIVAGGTVGVDGSGMRGGASSTAGGGGAGDAGRAGAALDCAGFAGTADCGCAGTGGAGGLGAISITRGLSRVPAPGGGAVETAGGRGVGIEGAVSSFGIAVGDFLTIVGFFKVGTGRLGSRGVVGSGRGAAV